MQNRFAAKKALATSVNLQLNDIDWFDVLSTLFEVGDHNMRSPRYKLLSYTKSLSEYKKRKEHVVKVECELKSRCYAPQAYRDLCRNIEFEAMSITWICEPY